MPVFSKTKRLRSVFYPNQNHSNGGFTLVELAVASVAALAVLVGALGMLSEQRRWMLGDRVRASVNDNLRLASDLIGQDIKQAGERLEWLVAGQATSSAFSPTAISIIPGATANDPSTLVLQRQLLQASLPVCQNIISGTTTIDVSVETGGSVANCPYSYTVPTGGEPSTALSTLRPTNNLREWRTFRCTQESSTTSAEPCTATTSGATAWAYIHDSVNNRGEFFQYDLETKGSCNLSAFSSRTCQKIRRVGSTWTYNYTYNNTVTVSNPSGNSANPLQLYLFEERRYNLVSDTSTSRTDDFILQLTINRQTPRRVANQVRNFQVWAKVPSAYTSAPFTAPANWGCAISGTGATAPNPAAPTQWYCTAFNVNITNTDPVQRLQSIRDWQELQGIRMTLTGINPNDQALKVNTTAANNLLKLSSEFLPRNITSR